MRQDGLPRSPTSRRYFITSSRGQWGIGLFGRIVGLLPVSAGITVAGGGRWRWSHGLRHPPVCSIAWHRPPFSHASLPEFVQVVTGRFEKIFRARHDRLLIVGGVKSMHRFSDSRGQASLIYIDVSFRCEPVEALGEPFARCAHSQTGAAPAAMKTRRKKQRPVSRCSIFLQ